MGKNVNTESRVIEAGKAVVVETAQQGKLTDEGEKFLSLYLDRINQGKAFASAGQGLRFAKSEETLAFWGPYAVSAHGFGGVEVFKAPAFSKEVLQERLKALGWTNKRLPSGYVTFAKKHKIPLTDFEKACYDQEQASRKAGEREELLDIIFPDTIMDYFVKLTKDDDSPALGKVIAALECAIRKKLADK